MIFHAIAIILAAWSAITGFRTGFKHQIPSILGVCFGIVCVRIFSIPVEEYIMELLPSRIKDPEAAYFYSSLSSAVIFTPAYFVFSFPLRILWIAFKDEETLFSSIFGSVTNIILNIFFLSIVYNLILAVTVDPAMIKAAGSSDGNMVALVSSFAPALFGGVSPTDLALALQFYSAKFIS